MLKPYFSDPGILEAGLDEAGRGCLAGPVCAAAVILPSQIPQELLHSLNDSKKLSATKRQNLRPLIVQHAMAWAVAWADHEEIDRINILKASFLAMHRAIEQLTLKPGLLLIDGNRFTPYPGIAHQCIVKGDGLYLAIAAASVLAKTYRDDFMQQQHLLFPEYGWNKNMGYPTLEHRRAIHQNGLSPLHRKTFNSGLQIQIPFRD